MLKKTVFFYLLFLFAIATISFSQEAIETPQHFGQFYNNPMLNIARNGLSSKFELNLDNQRTSGGFAGVSTYYASFFYNSSRRKSKNIFGLYVYNDKEGDFISRKRTLLSYSRHQKISKNLFLSVGLSTGLFLFDIKPSTQTGAYSDNSFEGNASLLLHSKTIQIGLSVNQFSNNTIQPVTQIIRLKRHYYLFGEYKYKLSSDLNMASNIFVRYRNLNSNSRLKKMTYGISQRIYLNIILLGVGIENNSATAIFGLNKLKLGDYTVGFDFSYRFPSAKNNSINVNLIELNLKLKKGYFIKDGL